MIQTVLTQAVAASRPAAELGQTASYIPELSKVDKHHLAPVSLRRTVGGIPQEIPRCASVSKVSPR